MSKTLIAVPTAGGLHECTAAWYACMTRRSDVGLAIVTGRPHDYVRNAIVRQFLAGDFTHLLMIDSDIEPPLDALDKLLDLDVPLATGCYPLVGPHGPCWALANRDAAGHYPLLRRLPTKPTAVDAAGCGCLLIRRDVFDLLAWPWFKWVERQDGSQMGEDIYFFEQCRQVDLRVVAHPDVLCRHYKTVDLLALAQAQAESRSQHKLTSPLGETKPLP